jgi:hypothetical protein
VQFDGRLAICAIFLALARASVDIGFVGAFFGAGFTMMDAAIFSGLPACIGAGRDANCDDGCQECHEKLVHFVPRLLIKILIDVHEATFCANLAEDF